MLTDSVITTILSAEAKAFATTGPHGVNVVPVSVITIHDDAIFLYDFFMRKTVDNLLQNPLVALTAWRGFSGVQVKGRAEYITNGPEFETVVETFRQQFPDRVLTGVIRITPSAIFDISADITKSGTQIV